MTSLTERSNKPSAKARAATELRELSVNASYLALFFCAFAAYRALITGELQDKTVYVRFGTSIITALVIAKTILVGDWLGLGRQSKHRETPLIARTLYMSLVYGGFVFAISIVERILEGLLRGIGMRDTMRDFTHLGWQEITARSIVILLALIPFFAFRELARQAGEERTYDLFFHRTQSDDANRPARRSA